MGSFINLCLLFCLTSLLRVVRGNDDLAVDKSLLRYGFQKTSACKDFEKAYMCVRKCLDLNFDIGQSDKECKCKCYRNRDKAAYTKPRKYNATKWRLGAPTTKRPLWAIPPEEYTKKPKNDAENKEVDSTIVSGNSSVETNHTVEGNSTPEEDHSPADGEETTTLEDPNHAAGNGEEGTTPEDPNPDHSPAENGDATPEDTNHAPDQAEESTPEAPDG